MGAFSNLGNARCAGNCAPQPAEPVHRAFTHAHARELHRWSGGLDEVKAQGLDLGVRATKPFLELSPMPRQHHDVPYRNEEQGDRRQCRQISDGCVQCSAPGHDNG